MLLLFVLCEVYLRPEHKFSIIRVMIIFGSLGRYEVSNVFGAMWFISKNWLDSKANSTYQEKLIQILDTFNERNNFLGRKSLCTNCSIKTKNWILTSLRYSSRRSR